MKTRLASTRCARLLPRLAKDTSGNTLALIAASLFPLIGMLGGGIDIGRAYVSQTRLQQACDAGVLAARKSLGTEAAVSGEIPKESALAGERFFNLNFDSGAYGSENRTFNMTLEDDFSVTGVATVDVPTTLMAVFGYDEVPIEVTCQAQLNMANTDIMMVLDVTGSMAQTNPGDSVSRMEALKTTVRDFHAQLVAAAPPSSRLRFGFVPYSTNVNVGGLLKDEWVNTDWRYQSRDRIKANVRRTRTYERNWTYKSGSVGAPQLVSSYPATYRPGSPGYTYVDANEKVVTVPPKGASYSCNGGTPRSTYTRKDKKIATRKESFPAPNGGGDDDDDDEMWTRTIETYERTENGTTYYTRRSGTTCYVYSRQYNTYVRTFERVREPHITVENRWRYHQLKHDVRKWRSESNGCIEERATYEISDYSKVDLTRALDLDLDLVPTSNPRTKWSPMYPHVVFERAMKYNGKGSFSKATKITKDEYLNPAVLGTAACPAAARKLGTMTASQLDSYLKTLKPTGSTYHDIGMIWGGRLLSATGLFASENADVSSTRPSNRHLIFLTDGETAPLDISYSSYGVEPLDERRWRSKSSLSLAQVVEKRFSVACNEVKKKNISVWVISFGTAANPIMQDCAGADRYFVADDATELQETFATIAKRMGELRVTR